MKFNQITQSQPASAPEQHQKRIIGLGKPAAKDPKAAQKLRHAFLNIETQAAGRVTIGVN